MGVFEAGKADGIDDVDGGAVVVAAATADDDNDCADVADESNLAGAVAWACEIKRA